MATQACNPSVQGGGDRRISGIADHQLSSSFNGKSSVKNKTEWEGKGRILNLLFSCPHIYTYIHLHIHVHIYYIPTCDDAHYEEASKTCIMGNGTIVSPFSPFAFHNANVKDNSDNKNVYCNISGSIVLDQPPDGLRPLFSPL